jgi:hypothetical protein
MRVQITVKELKSRGLWELYRSFSWASTAEVTDSTLYDLNQMQAVALGLINTTPLTSRQYMLHLSQKNMLRTYLFDTMDDCCRALCYPYYRGDPRAVDAPRMGTPTISVLSVPKDSCYFVSPNRVLIRAKLCEPAERQRAAELAGETLNFRYYTSRTTLPTYEAGE